MPEEKAPKPAGEKNYDFHSSAVDDLVDAQHGRTKAYDERELRQYRTRKGIIIKDWIKVILLKWWFAGVVCYFMFWGLNSYLPNHLDKLFVVSIAMGLVTDLLQNTMLSFMEKTPHANDRWQMFPKTKIISLLLNILYAFVLVYCVYQTYESAHISFGVEPIFFGILYTAFDLLFIGIKRTCIRIFKDAKSTVDREAGK